jgi:hypothetical protein
MLAALLRPLFDAEGGEQARELVGEAPDRFRDPLSKVAALLEEAEGPVRLLRLPGRPRGRSSAPRMKASSRRRRLPAYNRGGRG